MNIKNGTTAPSNPNDQAKPGAPSPEPADYPKLARTLSRSAQYATLATTHYESGDPYASLVATATTPEGNSVLLLSDLAIHTKNIAANEKACLLFQDPSGDQDPLETGRLSVWGNIQKTENSNARQRFLYRHQSAEAYADFTDFSFYKMTIAGGHFIGGFGRIKPLTADELLVDCNMAAEFIDLEYGFLQHMNKDHSDAVARYATQLLGQNPGDWRMTGLDPEGFDLSFGRHSIRYNFDRPIFEAEEMRKKLVDLAQQTKTSP